MGRIPADVFQQVGVGFQNVILLYKLRQIGQFRDPLLDLCLGTGAAAELLHDPAQLGAGLGIPGIGGLAQGSVLRQLARQQGHFLVQGNGLLQTCQGLLIFQALGKGVVAIHQLGQRLHIGSAGRVVKAPVNGVKVPYFIHGKFLPVKTFVHILHENGEKVNRFPQPPAFVEIGHNV